MNFSDFFTWVSAVVFLIYGINYMVNGRDRNETIAGFILIILSIGLFAI